MIGHLAREAYSKGVTSYMGEEVYRLEFPLGMDIRVCMVLASKCHFKSIFEFNGVSVLVSKHDFNIGELYKEYCLIQRLRPPPNGCLRIVENR